MINIRRGFFETNSSSNDRYDDYEEPRYYGYIEQNVQIDLEFEDNAPHPMEFCDWLIDEDFDNAMGDIFYPFFDSPVEDDGCVRDVDWNRIYLRFEFKEYVSWTKGYAGTRYSPPEPPEAYYRDDYHCIPYGKEPFSNKAEVEKAILDAVNKNPQHIKVKSVTLNVGYPDETSDDLYEE